MAQWQPGEPRVAIVTDILAFLGHYRPTGPDLTPARLRVNSVTMYELVDPYSDPPGLGEARRGLWGLTVVVDYTLPPGVWRVCAADDTLLHDSRSPERPS